ncbi:MAG: hypothetical protein KatS3mg057_1242 [Herpetosiphonaceae bacterium]|nr:MAG: hypothetical protein KatS3mg057_1242 [Herpetosiphonaceae bacterium]
MSRFYRIPTGKKGGIWGTPPKPPFFASLRDQRVDGAMALGSDQRSIDSIAWYVTIDSKVLGPST